MASRLVQLAGPATPWWTSSIIRAALISLVSLGVAYASRHGWIISNSAESIADTVLTAISAGAAVFAIFKRVSKPVNSPVIPAVMPGTVKSIQESK